MGSSDDARRLREWAVAEQMKKDQESFQARLKAMREVEQAEAQRRASEQSGQ